uniref:Uncharacterized protein n=1 Tax=viral metagenome TaxID=1070528 RepID=A0A2V0RI86_9ZZZZ
MFSELSLSVIQRPKRDGFRAAKFAYITNLHDPAARTHETEMDGPQDGEFDPAKIDVLANRMAASTTQVRKHLSMIHQAMLETLSPGETKHIAEAVKNKKRIDLQSLLCTGLARNLSKDGYVLLTDELLLKSAGGVVYTEPIVIQEVDNFTLHVDVPYSGTARILDYATSPDGIPRVTPIVTDMRIHSGSNEVIISSAITRDPYAPFGAVTTALNVHTMGTAFNRLVDILEKAEFATIGDRDRCPFIVESGELGDGTIIIHAFPQIDGSALTNWMEYSTQTMKRMLTSMLNTLSNKMIPQAYTATRLGGQFPIDFYTILGNYVDGMNGIMQPRKTVKASIQLEEILTSYYNCASTGKMNDRMRNTFKTLKTGNTPDNLSYMRQFIESYLTFTILFGVYDDFAKFNANVNGVQDVKRQERCGDVLKEFKVKGEYALDEFRNMASSMLTDLFNAPNRAVHLTKLAEECSKPIAIVNEYLKKPKH